MVEPFIPRVKVCGVTTLEVAHAAELAGADAIGLVAVAHSPRSVGLSRAANIARALGAKTRAVLVLVDCAPHAALEWIHATGASALQLCGSESPDDWRGFSETILRRVAVERGAEQEIERWHRVAAAFVLDHPSSAGGSGRTVDFGHAARLAALAPCVLAGGLDAHNVGAAIREVSPFGVDASSRLEVARGVKDVGRVNAFVAAARRAFAEHKEVR